MIFPLEPPKIPAAIGFTNHGGSEFSGMQADDAATLSPLFAQASIASAGSAPRAGILFVYADLDENGLIPGLGSASLREVAARAQAVILVVASPNPVDRIGKAVALPGPKTANLVLTLDRNGRGFPKFFRALFETMSHGKGMLSAWVELNPQGPVEGNLSNPDTLLIPEAGELTFRHSSVTS